MFLHWTPFLYCPVYPLSLPTANFSALPDRLALHSVPVRNDPYNKFVEKMPSPHFWPDSNTDKSSRILIFSEKYTFLSLVIQKNIDILSIYSIKTIVKMEFDI